jgi:GMP synthase (glutamine-hydrolysing)
MSLKTAVALRHVHFEDLGALADPLEAAGYAVRYHDVGIHELRTLERVKTELVIVLGGPVGAYESRRYPFLADEIRLLEDRLAAGRPTLGICLGAQLMARALGASVHPAPTGEIGWAPVELTDVRARCAAPSGRSKVSPCQ